jgi:hypothetical protein
MLQTWYRRSIGRSPRWRHSVRGWRSSERSRPVSSDEPTPSSIIEVMRAWRRADGGRRPMDRGDQLRAYLTRSVPRAR